MDVLWESWCLLPEAEQLLFTSDCRVAILGVYAQVWWRFQIPFGSFPYKLLTLVDPAATDAEKNEIARAVINGPRCCLDSACTHKVRAAHDSPESLLSDKELMNVLLMWAIHGRVCSMHVERMFAQIRCSVPDGAYAERIVSCGFLSQLLKKHRECGGIAPSSFRRSDALDMGLPTRAHVDDAILMPKRARGHLAHIIRRHNETKAASGDGKSLSKEEAASIRAQAAQEYREMSFQQQRSLSEEAVSEATVSASRIRQERESTEESRASSYKSEDMWSMGVRNSPLSPSLARSLIKKELGGEKVAFWASRSQGELRLSSSFGLSSAVWMILGVVSECSGHRSALISNLSGRAPGHPRSPRIGFLLKNTSTHGIRQSLAVVV